MSNRSKPEWREPGFEYAKNFTAITAAQEVFEDDRRRILSYLQEKLTDTHSKVLRNAEVYGPKAGVLGFTINGEYVRAAQKRARKRGRPKSSGFTVWLANRHDQDPFGFYTALWFQMSKRRFQEIIPKHKKLAFGEAIGTPNLRVFGRSLPPFFGFVSFAEFGPDDPRFTVEAFLDETMKLPGLFAKADHWIASEYSQATGEDDE